MKSAESDSEGGKLSPGSNGEALVPSVASVAPVSHAAEEDESSPMTGVPQESPSEYDGAIQHMVMMGFAEEQVKAAMRAAFNNPERAVEYLLDPSHMPNDGVPYEATKMHYVNSSGSKANVDASAVLERAQAILSEGHRLLNSGDAAGALIQYEKCRASGEAMADGTMKRKVLGAAIGSLGNARRGEPSGKPRERLHQPGAT